MIKIFWQYSIVAVLLLLYLPASAENLIEIISPTKETVFYRGQNIQLQFKADPSVSDIAAIGAFKGAFSETKSDSNIFTIAIPPDAEIGRSQLSVIGFANKQLVSSAPLIFEIDTPLEIEEIKKIDLSPLIMDKIGEKFSLQVTGRLSDGKEEWITHSHKISYASSATNVAIVDSDGRVTAVSPGDATIIISGAKEAPYFVAVKVKKPPAPAPILDPKPGAYDEPQQVTVSGADQAAVYYTTDGSLPTPKSIPYTKPISVSATQTINVLAVAPNDKYSNPRSTAWGTYTIKNSAITQSATANVAPAAKSQADTSTGTISPEFIDPVASGFVTTYSGGTIVSTDTDLLASGGTPVRGMAADGVSQVLIRIPATSAGQQFTIVAANGGDGGLMALGDTKSAPAASLVVTSVATSKGPMAFAIYRAPNDFTPNLTFQVTPKSKSQ